MNFKQAIVALSATAAFASAQSIVDIAVNDGRFDTLVAAVLEAGLADTLSGEGTFTVFAPTDDAFKNVDVEQLLEDQWSEHLKAVLLYHVLGSEVFSKDLEEDLSVETLEGSDVTVTSLDPPQINNAEILIADIEADNGVIHVIDDVLLPPSLTKSIVEIAVEDVNFSTLVELVVLAGLDEALSSEGPFTVFAPTNDAFDKLPKETVDALVADPSGALTDILTYHVVPGIVTSRDLMDGTMAETLNGAKVDISLDPAMINDSKVVAADILAANGVIHVIDTVLIPPAPTMASDSYQSLQSLQYDGPGDACVEVKGDIATNGQRAILGDCSHSGWKVSDKGMIHSEIDDDFCLQAGYPGPNKMLGSAVRIQHCNENNHYQRWVFSGATLRPSLDHSLCAVWRGTTADVGDDPILMLPCSHVEDKSDWKLV